LTRSGSAGEGWGDVVSLEWDLGMGFHHAGPQEIVVGLDEHRVPVNVVGAADELAELQLHGFIYTHTHTHVEKGETSEPDKNTPQVEQT